MCLGTGISNTYCAQGANCRLLCLLLVLDRVYPRSSPIGRGMKWIYMILGVLLPHLNHVSKGSYQ